MLDLCLRKLGFLLEAALLPRLRPRSPVDEGGLIGKKSDTDHRRRGVAPLFLAVGSRLERGMIMVWTSDRAGVLLYTIVGMFLVLSSICLPA